MIWFILRVTKLFLSDLARSGSDLTICENDLVRSESNFAFSESDLASSESV